MGGHHRAAPGRELAVPESWGNEGGGSSTPGQENRILARPLLEGKDHNKPCLPLARMPQDLLPGHATGSLTEMPQQSTGASLTTARATVRGLRERWQPGVHVALPHGPQLAMKTKKVVRPRRRRVRPRGTRAKFAAPTSPLNLPTLAPPDPGMCAQPHPDGCGWRRGLARAQGRQRPGALPRRQRLRCPLQTHTPLCARDLKRYPPLAVDLESSACHTHNHTPTHTPPLLAHPSLYRTVDATACMARARHPGVPWAGNPQRPEGSVCPTGKRRLSPKKTNVGCQKIS
jgi:hypothetical protein